MHRESGTSHDQNQGKTSEREHLTAEERGRRAKMDPHCLLHMNSISFLADGSPASARESIANVSAGRSMPGPIAQPLKTNITMTRISTVRDERQTTAEGMADALLNRIAPNTKLSENGRRFRSMTLMELARELLAESGVSVRGMDRMSLAAAALQNRSMGSGDFTSILANVGNKRMRLAYEENPASYKIWARRAADAQNFKPISVVQMSGMPDLLQVREHGEYQYGKASDGAETYALLTYGRMVSLTRQALVNDDLRAFDVALAGFGNAAARFENRMVYSQLTENAALRDGVQLFAVGHNNLFTGSTSALQLSSLAAMRSAMRQQKGMQSEELNISPRYLIVPAALEQAAYQLTSANYVPARSADINEFRQGGRSSLEPVVEPLLDGTSSTAWYAAASSSQVDTIEYCYLDGADGPVLETKDNFTSDGMTMKCRLDFATKAIDFRGLYKANGS